MIFTPKQLWIDRLKTTLLVLAAIAIAQSLVNDDPEPVLLITSEFDCTAYTEGSIAISSIQNGKPTCEKHARVKWPDTSKPVSPIKGASRE
jgi:hypothetical protein